MPESVSPRKWRADDTPTPFLARAADRLYHTVAVQIALGRIDARSDVGHAALDYREKRDEFTTP